MRLRTHRRAIYAAMGLTVLALVGGFAAATLTTTITTGGQNGYNVTAPTGTMYAGGSQTTHLVDTTASACTSSGTISPASGATTASVFVTGEVACQTGAADWFEETSFTSTAVPNAAPSDAFEITVSTNAPLTITVSYSGLTSGTSIVTTNIYYEVGASGTADTSAIGINGS